MARPLSVLVVEDSLDDWTLMQRELTRAGYDATWERVVVADELRAALRSGRWDLCIADYSLPSFGATEALAIVRAEAPNLPFIVVSGTIGEERAVALMRAGADDYFLKGKLGRLAAAIESLVRRSAQLDRSEWRSNELETEKRVLEAAALAKSAFIASMNHELRTPLNAILGFSKLLLEQAELGEKHRRYLENVEEAGGHLLSLISDVLDLASLDAAKMKLRPGSIDLGVLLDPALAATRVASDAKGIRFDTRTPTGVALWADAVRVREILHNLLSNAVKFTPAGGAVSLGVFVDGDAIVLEVGDDGVGIPAESHDRVFGAFERLHEGVVAAPGTGLGLALTKQLVELHGGTITFVSAAGRGTTFRVRLPGTIAPETRAA